MPVAKEPRSDSTSRLAPGIAATTACLWEATAPKPGNVHPQASFADATHQDFVTSGQVIGPILERASADGVGPTVLAAIRATHAAVGTNTNLGTVLLLAPLAAVPLGVSLAVGIGEVLAALTTDDTRYVYEAIRVAGAGGLGRAAEADVHEEPPIDLTLVAAMRLAADRDLVARQYTNAFHDVFHGTAAWLAEGLGQGWTRNDAIVRAHLRQLATAPDSLVARKCGDVVAREAQRRAAAVLAAGLPDQNEYQTELLQFDAWLRGDGNRRNPGTSADLVAAGLFVLLRENRID